MSLETHLKELQRKHQALDAEIAAQQRAPSGNELSLQSLKKRKLKLKDEIERMRSRAS